MYPTRRQVPQLATSTPTHPSMSFAGVFMVLVTAKMPQTNQEAAISLVSPRVPLWDLRSVEKKKSPDFATSWLVLGVLDLSQTTNIPVMPMGGCGEGRGVRCGANLWWLSYFSSNPDFWLTRLMYNHSTFPIFK